MLLGHFLSSVAFWNPSAISLTLEQVCLQQLKLLIRYDLPAITSFFPKAQNSLANSSLPASTSSPFLFVSTLIPRIFCVVKSFLSIILPACLPPVLIKVNQTIQFMSWWTYGRIAKSFQLLHSIFLSYTYTHKIQKNKRTGSGVYDLACCDYKMRTFPPQFCSYPKY